MICFCVCFSFHVCYLEGNMSAFQNNAAQGRGSELLMCANPNPDPVPRPALGSAQLCAVPLQPVKC